MAAKKINILELRINWEEKKKKQQQQQQKPPYMKVNF